MAKMKILGSKELARGLEKRIGMDGIKKLVTAKTTQLHGVAVQKAQYTKGYSTGATRRSIGMQIHDGGLTGEVGMGMDYDPYLEKGTRFMEAQPALKPAYNQVKGDYIREIRNIMK